MKKELFSLHTDTCRYGIFPKIDIVRIAMMDNIHMEKMFPNIFSEFDSIVDAIEDNVERIRKEFGDDLHIRKYLYEEQFRKKVDDYGKQMDINEKLQIDYGPTK